VAKAPDNFRITTEFSLRLAALLRQRGVTVGTQQVKACVRAIALFEVIREEELKGIYRTTLVNRKQDRPHLDRAYDLLMQDFLSPPVESDDPDGAQRKRPIIVKTREYAGFSSPREDKEQRAETEGYSTREVDVRKDFRMISKRDVSEYVAALEKLARRHATLTRRKVERAQRRGHIDLRASLRESVRYGGEVVKLRFKRKRRTHSRFTIVCDVSGSMEIYNVFLMNFLHQLQRLRRIRIETYVFSTRLQSLTAQFRTRRFPEMLQDVSANFSGWSGGTKIGNAISALNDTYAGSITPKTVVVIMSDGWDTGEIPLLEEEMIRLHRRARAVLWVNPLLGDPDYQPLAAGMATARPHCDHFVAGHNIESFARLARLMDAVS
jgi:uncharacterized protein